MIYLDLRCTCDRSVRWRGNLPDAKAAAVEAEFRRQHAGPDCRPWNAAVEPRPAKPEKKQETP